MSRLAVENYVVFGVIVVTVTVTFQIISLPFIFAEIDAIRKEFDGEVHGSLKLFEQSYEQLSEIRPTSMRRERDLALQMVGATSTGPADHPTKVRRSSPPVLTTNMLRRAVFQKPSTIPPMKTTTAEYIDIDDDYEEEPDMLVDAPKNIPRREVPQPQPPAPNPSPSQLPMCPIEENRCPSGPPGPQGLRGLAGINGEDGNDGMPGIDAMDELMPTFAQFCTSCPAGPDGKPGINGAPGGPGLPGAPGIPGPNGKNGQPGAPGGYGPPGKQGNMGTRGNVGATGFDGVVMASQKGPKGPVGRNGPPGQAGEDGSNNNVEGPRGIVGYPGLQGAPGNPGLQGKRGDFGAQGMAGIKQTEECKCNDLIKRAIEVAEQSAYVAVEAIAANVRRQPQTAVSEIRRTPSKTNHTLPTLDDVRRDQHTLEKPKPAPVVADVKEIQKKMSFGPRHALRKVKESIKTIKETSTFPSVDNAVTQKMSFNTANQTLPIIGILETVDEESSTQKPETKPKTRLAKFVDRKYPKWRKEDGSAHIRKIRRRIRRVNRRRSPSRFEMDKVFEIEKEIARDSDKKIKIGKAEKKKKLKRVDLKPSRSLVEQNKKNTNILEEIAKSLGIIEENKIVEKSSDKLTRISIP